MIFKKLNSEITILPLNTRIKNVLKRPVQIGKDEVFISKIIDFYRFHESSEGNRFKYRGFRLLRDFGDGSLKILKKCLDKEGLPSLEHSESVISEFDRYSLEKEVEIPEEYIRQLLNLENALNTAKSAFEFLRNMNSSSKK